MTIPSSNKAIGDLGHVTDHNLITTALAGKLDTTTANGTYPARAAGTSTVAASLPFVTPEDFGAVGNNIADDTTPIQAAFNTGLPVRFRSKVYRVTATLVPKGNARIVGNRNKTQLNFTAAGSYLPIKNSAGVATGLFVRFDLSQLNAGVVEGIYVHGNGGANSVGWAASEEFAGTPNPYHLISGCRADGCTWAIYGPEDGAPSLQGGLLGAVFHDFVGNCANGIHLGTQSTDDIVFTGTTRLVSVTGYGVLKSGRTAPLFDSLYIGTLGAAAVAVQVNQAGVNIGSLFIESLDGNPASGVALVGTVTEPTSITIGDYHHNLANGSLLIRVLGTNDRVTVDAMRDRDWNGARPSSRLLSLEYAAGASVRSSGTIGYDGADTGSLLAFSFPAGDAGNASLASVFTLLTKSGRVQYRGAVAFGEAEFPTQVSILALTAAVAATNFSNVNLAISTAPMNMRRISSGAQGDSVTWETPLAAGTYLLSLAHESGPNRGIYTIEASSNGGASYSTLTTIDGYAAGEGPVYATVAGIGLSVTGRYRLRVRMATKNALSTEYFGTLSHLGLARTSA